MRLGCTALLVALTVLAMACAAPGGAVSTPIVKMAMPGIENFSRIDGSSGAAGSTVGFGGATEPAAMSALRDAGFASVISLRFASEQGAEIDASRAAAEAAALSYVHLPINPKVTDETVIESVLQAMGDPSNQPVYLHCGSATRAAALWMIERVLVDGLDVDAAAAEARAIAAKPDDAVAFATKYIESQRGE